MMKNWKDTRVLIIGAARQGLALARYLVTQGAVVTINDRQSKAALSVAVESLSSTPVQWVTGEHPLSLLDECDVISVSGGVPLDMPILQEAVRRGIPITNDTQVFLEKVLAPVIGITGSAGKTTTTTIVGRMAAAQVEFPQRCWVGGNIGNPLIDSVKEIHPLDSVVMEISSFQLEQLTISPKIAVVLNITPNHLDRHGTMEAYTSAKARILKYQTMDDIAILNRDDAGSWNLASQVRGRLISFGLKPITNIEGTFIHNDHITYQVGGRVEELIPLELIELRGEHNRMNVLAACAIAKAAGFSKRAIHKGIEGFGGVAHRMEFVREIHGVRWYNDSIATAPERSMAAIKSFTEPIVLLAGGRDKKLPWNEFTSLVHHQVKHVVLFGEAAGIIQNSLEENRTDHSGIESVSRFDRMEEAMKQAAELAQTGDVVLLSPGCTSYDAYKDFEERGEVFRKWVQQLT